MFRGSGVIQNIRPHARMAGVGLLAFLFLSNSLCFGANTKNIMLTGYWPPTNEMLRDFSNDPNYNPGVWVGSNWRGRGYDVYAFFPEFPGGTGSNSKGNGDFEVDYQDVSADFWRITGEIHPVAILSFGKGAGPWEIEYRARNLSSWSSDYLSPTQPTPSPPDSSVPSGYVRYSTLPVQEIADAINSAGIGVSAWVDWNGNPGAFLCEFMAYHDAWYQTLHSDESDPYQCIAAGFTHLSSMSVSTAKAGVEIALETTIDYLDSILVPSYILDISTSGSGSVIVNPDLSFYEPNSVVVLTAIPAEGSEFFRWIGDVQSNDNPLAVTMDGNKQITACFTDKPILAVAIVGNGSVSISPEQPYYEWDSEVTLTATPDVGAYFSKWSGDINDVNNPVTIIMDSDKLISAVFTGGEVTLIDAESFEDAWPPANWNVSGQWYRDNTDAYDGLYSARFEHTGEPQYTLMMYDDFEAGFGNYTDGGADCELYTGSTYAHQGSNAANIQDDDGTASSFYTTGSMNLDTPGYTSIRIDFWFYLLGMESGEGFFVEFYDGASWHSVAQYRMGAQFANGQFYHATVDVEKANFNFSSGAKIRFRNDASGNYDDSYIDEVRIEGLSYSAGTGSGDIETCPLDCSDAAAIYIEFSYYSNTAAGDFLLECFDGSSWQQIFDMSNSTQGQWHYYQGSLLDSRYRTGQMKLRWADSNMAGGETARVDMITVSKEPGVGAVITQQPTNKNALPGATVRFNVAATGTAPITYSWQRYADGDWYDISGANGPALQISNLISDDLGNYRCLVSNDFAAVYSEVVILTFGDLDGFAPVNLFDFAILANHWCQETLDSCDINGDSTVDFQDVVILSDHWLGDFSQ